MKPIRWKKETISQHPFDVYDVIELYKAEIIDLNEARYLAAECMNTSMFFDKKHND
jgi:hypothetical protein